MGEAKRRRAEIELLKTQPKIKLVIDDKFKEICHSVIWSMLDDKTIDFSQAPYETWLYGPAFHRGEIIDLNKTDVITCATSGQHNDPKLDPIKLCVGKGYVDFQTKHQTYRMEIKEKV